MVARGGMAEAAALGRGGNPLGMFLEKGGCMTFPKEIAAAVIQATAKELADRLERDGLEDLRLFTAADVAERLKVSLSTARALMREHVDLGEASKRVTPAILRRMIEERTVRP